MQNRVENSAGVAGREPVGRFDCDENQPQNHRNPSLPYLMLARIRNSAQGLFRRIVRRLARDHDIVYMTFAQTGNADAHKSRLLQKLRHGRATRVPHA